MSARTDLDAEHGRLSRPVMDYYESRLREFGPTPQGMDWKGASSQDLRFHVLSEVCDLNGLSVHDVGAGVGHLLDFLHGKGLQVDYSGSDLSGEMVESARARHSGVHFDKLDILADESERQYDVVVCSGLFHVKLSADDDQWSRFMKRMIRRMFALSRVATAFNLMSSQVDFRNERLFYSKPEEILEFCRRELSRFVAVRHDYPLHEYTVYVYRDEHVRGS